MSKSKVKSSPPAPVGTKRGTKVPPYPTSLKAVLFVAFVLLFHPFFAIAGAVKLAVLVALPEGEIRSGKSGTVVWLRNGVMRVKVIPSLVRNSYTTFVRGNLSDFSALWRGLSQAQQDGWIAQTGFKSKNRIGKVTTPTGKRLYTMLNCNLAALGIAAISDAPAPVAVGVPTMLTNPVIKVGTTTITLASLVAASASWGLIYEATSILSFGINRPKNSAFRTFLADSDSTALSTAASVWTAYVTKFGVPAAGDTVFMRFTFIDNTVGQQSIASQVFKCVVIA